MEIDNIEAFGMSGAAARTGIFTTNNEKKYVIKKSIVTH